MARTQQFTDEQIIKGLKKSKGLVYVAAHAIGCDAHTIYARLKAVSEVKRALDEARGLLVDKAEGKLAAAVSKGQGWAIQFTLKTLGKDRGYVERTEHTGRDGGPIRFVKGLFDDDEPAEAQA